MTEVTHQQIADQIEAMRPIVHAKWREHEKSFEVIRAAHYAGIQAQCAQIGHVFTKGQYRFADNRSCAICGAQEQVTSVPAPGAGTP